jgi:flagellar basal body rod protein FlgB
MLKGLFGPTTVTSMLRGGLEETSATHRGIAARVAGAIDASSSTDFPGDLARSQAAQADLERDMTQLADTQLRYEAEARLLREAYDGLRTAMKSSG